MSDVGQRMAPPDGRVSPNGRERWQQALSLPLQRKRRPGGRSTPRSPCRQATSHPDRTWTAPGPCPKPDRTRSLNGPGSHLPVTGPGSAPDPAPAPAPARARIWAGPSLDRNRAEPGPDRDRARIGIGPATHHHGWTITWGNDAGHQDGHRGRTHTAHVRGGRHQRHGVGASGRVAGEDVSVRIRRAEHVGCGRTAAHVVSSRVAVARSRSPSGRSSSPGMTRTFSPEPGSTKRISTSGDRRRRRPSGRTLLRTAPGRFSVVSPTGGGACRRSRCWVAWARKRAV